MLVQYPLEKFESPKSVADYYSSIVADWSEPTNLSSVDAVFEDGSVMLRVASSEYLMTKTALRALSASVQAPVKYMTDLLDEDSGVYDPEQAVYILNRRLAASTNIRRIFRIYHSVGSVSMEIPVIGGIVGPRYPIFFTNEIVFHKIVLPYLHQFSNSVEDVNGLIYAAPDRFRMDIYFGSRRIEVLPGDFVDPGFRVLNSENWGNAFLWSFFLYRLVCQNGMVLGKEVTAYRKIHRAKNPEEFLTRVQNELHEALPPSKTDELIDILRESAKNPNEIRNVDVAFEMGSRILGYPKKLAPQFLDAYEGPANRWGFANAITRAAQEFEPDDRASLEELGGRVITLSPSQWRIIAEADVD